MFPKLENYFLLSLHLQGSLTFEQSDFLKRNNHDDSYPTRKGSAQGIMDHLLHVKWGA